MGGAFTASIISILLIQHGRASNKYFGQHLCGHHIYKQIWQPLVGEILTLEQEEGDNYDKFAVSLLKHATVIVMFLKSIHGVWYFLRHGGTITCEVTG